MIAPLERRAPSATATAASLTGSMVWLPPRRISKCSRGLARAARAAGAGDGLALLDHVVLLDQQRLVVAVGGDVARAVLDQQQVAEMGHAVAGIDHLAAVGCLHRRAVGGRNVDAVALLAARAAVGRDDLAAAAATGSAAWVRAAAPWRRPG